MDHKELTSKLFHLGPHTWLRLEFDEGKPEAADNLVKLFEEGHIVFEHPLFAGLFRNVASTQDWGENNTVRVKTTEAWNLESVKLFAYLLHEPLKNITVGKS
jgi:hypothetical protein